MIVNKYNNGGGSSSGSSQYASSAGTALFSDKTLLLEGINGFPVSATTGDVIAINGVPTRGLRSGSPEAGVYQYDGSDWNKIDGGNGYKIELSTNEPDDFTEGDIANLNDFFDAVKEDPSIVKDAYLDIHGEFYRCSYEDYYAQNRYFDFVICSRYHGCVHAYKNLIPGLILGSTIRYKELAKLMNQEKYY